MAAVENNAGGVGILGLLGVVFVTLKLCDVIGWSWWWVTVPFWGVFAVAVAFLAIAGLMSAISRVF